MGQGGGEGSGRPPALWVRPKDKKSWLSDGDCWLSDGQGFVGAPQPPRAVVSFPPVFIGVNPNAITSHRLVFLHHIACKTCDKKKECGARLLLSGGPGGA